LSQEYLELRGPSGFELRRLDRVLSELARPTLCEMPPAPHKDPVATSTREALLELGVCVSGEPSRRDLMESLWGRKGLLLHQLGSAGDWGPMRPVA
jgi:hypothetical protein